MQGAKTSFTAFFGAAGIGGRAGIHAFISRSTRVLRKMLREAGGGLEFTMPLAPMQAANSDAAARAGSGQVGERCSHCHHHATTAHVPGSNHQSQQMQPAATLGDV